MSKGQKPMEMVALETPIEKLQKSLSGLLKENERHTANTKGKAKATEQDDEREADIRRKLEHLDNVILDIRGSIRDRYNVTKQPIDATPDHDPGPMATSTSYEPGITVAEDEDEEPIWNPFTSSYAYRKTGFEPGPSGLSGDSRQLRQNLKQEREVLTDARPGFNKNFAEVNAGNDPLRGDLPPSTERREVVIQGLDSRDIPISQSSEGKLAGVGNILQSCRRWLFKWKSSVDDTNQGLPSQVKSPSQFDLSSPSKSPVTASMIGLASAGLVITDTPRSSMSLRGDILQRVETKTGYGRLPSHGDGIRRSAERQVKDVSSKPASSAFPHEYDSAFVSETLRQRLSESPLPRSYSPSLQQRAHGSDCKQYTSKQQERGMQQRWSETEASWLVSAFEEEDKFKTKERESSRRLAMRLQLQEDREVAERQELLEMESLQAGRQLREAVLETERRAAVEAEHLQEELRAQEFFLKADAELAARLHGLNRAIRSDREVAEQLQAEIEREFAAEHPSTPPEIGSLYGRSPTDRVRNSTQTSQPPISDDKAFARILQEEEEKRAAKEEEALSQFIVWEKAVQSVDRRQPRSHPVLLDTNASLYAWNPQPDQAQASRGSQAVPRTVPPPDEANDEVECLTCTESFPKTQLVRPCEHFYCRGCIAAWFQRAVTEKPKQRPQCCKRILPVNLVSQQLGADFVKRYKLFELEIETPNPLYCSNRKCGAFVPPKNIHGDIGKCRCRRRTCRHCRAREHPNSLCIEDEETQRVEALGKREGWKHCPSCEHMIEKTEGCLHMKCTQCQTNFCWNCLKKNCDGTCPR